MIFDPTAGDLQETELSSCLNADGTSVRTSSALADDDEGDSTLAYTHFKLVTY